MTPKQAIRNECKFCNNTTTFVGCASGDCKLNDSTLTQVKRIKAHCLTCVPEQTYEGVRSCSGQVANFEDGRACPLHPFRLGKNPHRKGIGNLKGNMEGLKQARAVLSQRLTAV